MISIQQAIAFIIEHRKERQTQTVSLTDAIGATLAEDVRALVTLPPLAASAMDGYAVKLKDVRNAGAKLKIIGESPAGTPFKGTVNSGEAVRIFTGGTVPKGTDHIVIQENAERNGDRLTTLFDNETSRHIRAAGIDFNTGDKLIRQGTVLDPMHIALAAAANHAKLIIYKRPVVALIANGDELRAPGSSLNKSDIISSNPAGLGALIRQWGGEVMDMGIATDNIKSITKLIVKAKGADIIIPIGGASVGDHDHMRNAFKSLGLISAFEKVAVRPGKPTWFGTLGNQLILGLPGNPSSAIVCAHLFLKIVMDRADMQNFTKATLTEDIPANGLRETYMRAKMTVSLKGQLEVMPFPRQDSSLLTPFTRANALIRLPIESGPWTEGEIIDILPLGTGPDFL